MEASGKEIGNGKMKEKVVLGTISGRCRGSAGWDSGPVGPL
jgi:hypothetical protein